MQLKKSIGSGQSADVATEEAISTYSADVIPRPQLNTRMVQNVLLIWLDQNIDENNGDCCNTIKQLRRVINSVNTFTDRGSMHVEFLQQIWTQEKVCMIISGSLCQHIVTRIHNIVSTGFNIHFLW